MVNLLTQKPESAFGVSGSGANFGVVNDLYNQQIFDKSLVSFDTKDFLVQNQPQSSQYRVYKPHMRRTDAYERHGISKSIIDAIAESRSLLDLPDDWDGEGSARYESAVWAKASDFLKRIATNHKDKSGVWIVAPAILAGPDGSIDLKWELRSRRLLMNIPASNEKPIEFYGDNRAGQVVKGPLPITADFQWLLMWLTS